mgnify:CR=1 FL=1
MSENSNISSEDFTSNLETISEEKLPSSLKELRQSQRDSTDALDSLLSMFISDDTLEDTCNELNSDIL